jgi:putative peptide zinc metalloprotease protein
VAESFFSPSWYRVEGLQPRLRSHLRVHRHQYRGQTWYVLQDLATDQFHRFSPEAYGLIGLMDGRRTVQEIWEQASERLGDEAPTQNDVIGLISQLHTSDALFFEAPPDMVELSKRSATQVRRKRYTRLANIFSWRMPLCDPDRFLARFLPLVRPLISLPGLLLWTALVGMGLLWGGTYWTALFHDFSDQALAPQNLVLLWLLFPLLKLCHELGHGFMAKAFGAEVHELGVMLLVFTPVPYVETTGAWGFRSKWQRILVSAAGMMVELALASLALIVWINAEPGLVRVLAYNTILIAGISTVLFNANPLLRFDGYYMLMDYLEIPNMKHRAGRYFSYLAERYLLGQPEAEMPQATAGERVWFVLYGTASSLYRILVVVGILLFLGDQFPPVAILFAVFTGVMMVVVPVVKGATYLFTSPRLHLVRVRAVVTVVCLVAALVGVVGFVPVPFRTVTEGIVWLSDDAMVRAETEGFVTQVVATPGSQVQAGDVLFICRNADLRAQLNVLNSRLQELKARHTEQEPNDRTKAAIIEEETKYVTQERDRIRERVERLVVRSKQSGTFVTPRAEDFPGKYVRQGDLMGQVLDLRTVTVRTVVPQGEIDLVRYQLESVDVRLAERLPATQPAALVRLVPAATKQLPSAALGSQGGGQVPLEPSDEKGLTAMGRFFQADLTLANSMGLMDAGGRAYVRFNHGWMPLSAQWTRQLRQLFLARFNV